MADSDMKQRQQCIVAREASSRDKYSGVLYRLFSTAKALAWLANLHWVPLHGVQAEISLVPLPQNLRTQLDEDKSMLAFLTSCLATCLDCACDLLESQPDHVVLRNAEATSHFESASTVISCICLWLSMLCGRGRVVLQEASAAAEILRLRRASEELRQKVFGMLAPPIKKCLVRLTNSAIHGESADLALQSVLGLIRTAVGLTSASVEEQGVEPPPTQMENASYTHHPEQHLGDDLFGSMDDALFMSIDLDVAGDQGRRGDFNDGRTTDTVDQDIQTFKDIWTILIDMIKLTKVRVYATLLTA